MPVHFGVYVWEARITYFNGVLVKDLSKLMVFWKVFFQEFEKMLSHISCEIGKCSLCNNEKLEIALYKGDNLLNKRNEIISTCRHRFKYKLVNLTF